MLLSLSLARTHRGVTSSQFPSKHLFLIMSSSVIASSAVGGGATRVARSTSTVASSRLRATTTNNNRQTINGKTLGSNVEARQKSNHQQCCS